MGTERIQGIIFDLDGTLYQMKFLKTRMTFRLLNSVTFLRRLFSARIAVRQLQFENRQALLDCFYEELARRCKKSPAQAKSWYENDFYNAFVRVLRQARPRTGLDSLLGNLREKGIKLAVVSDFSHVRERLEALQIDTGYFDILKCSEEYGVLKPAPEPFLSVARLWNLAPASVLVVGDREDTDGEGARRAGMPFLGITDKLNSHADFYSWNDALIRIETITNCGVNV
ncbi:MAG: HAD family hydrolase [Deltaproteobacteria bacterium]|nr:HAD family hydrolase [Deltaproteobacteria bacterium]